MGGCRLFHGRKRCGALRIGAGIGHQDGAIRGDVGRKGGGILDRGGEGHAAQTRRKRGEA